MARESIGTVPCQACGEPAEVRIQKNGRSYVLCNDPLCGFQGFTRSDHADKKLRGRMIAKAAPAAADQVADQDQPTNQTKKGFFDGIL